MRQHDRTYNLANLTLAFCATSLSIIQMITEYKSKDKDSKGYLKMRNVITLLSF